MKIKNFLILIGPPGSGKGTQGKLLAPILDYNYLSLGQTLREISRRKHDERANQIKKLINKGMIIPDEMINNIVLETIKNLPREEGVILDGFPRDIEQVSILDEAIAKFNVDRVKAIFIDVPKIKLLQRLKLRQDARADDDPEVIETRFKEYDKKTHPILDYFDKQHKLLKVNGDQTVEEVHADILKKLDHGHKIRI
jgi:adenylate kinase